MIHLITTTNKKNNSTITITDTATIGKINSDVYSANIKINTIDLMNEVDRYGLSNIRVYLKLKCSIYSNNATQTLYATIGSLVIYNGVLPSDQTYLTLDLTTALENGVQGLLDISLNLFIGGSATTSYLTFKTENVTTAYQYPLIYFRKRDLVHPSPKNRYITLPLKFGGESLIDLFNSNVKHVVSLFDIEFGSIKYPFYLIYDKLNSNQSYIRSSLPSHWSTSLDLRIEKSNTYNNQLGDKTVLFYDSLNQVHILKPVWFYIINGLKYYINDTSSLHVPTSGEYAGKVCITIDNTDIKAYIEILSDDGYRFFSDNLQTDESILNMYEYDGDYLIDSSSNRYYFKSDGTLDNIKSSTKEYQIKLNSTNINIKKLENNTYVSYSLIYTSNVDNISYHINDTITNTYNLYLIDNKLSTIAYRVTGNDMPALFLSYSNDNLICASNSLTERNEFIYDSLNSLISFKHENQIDYLNESFEYSSDHNYILNSTITYYGNNIKVIDSLTNTTNEYIFNADGSISKIDFVDQDTAREYVSSTANYGEYTKSNSSLEKRNDYLVYSKSTSSTSGIEINYVDDPLVSGINKSSFKKLEALVLEVDLSSLSMEKLMCNRLNISIYPYNSSGYTTSNVYKTTLYTLLKGNYYVPFFYIEGDTKIKIEFSYDRTIISPNISKLKVYKGEALYAKQNRAYFTTNLINNNSIVTTDYNRFNKPIVVYKKDESLTGTSYNYYYYSNGDLHAVMDNYINTISYIYDNLHRVTKETYSKYGNSYMEKNYTYDSMGNRINESQIKNSNNEYPTDSYEYINNTSVVSKYENFKGIKTAFNRDTNTFGLLSINLSPSSPLDITNYTYNIGQLVKLSSCGGSNSFTYTYDYLFRRINVKLPNSNDIAYEYLDNYNNSSLSITNGTKVTIYPPEGTYLESCLDKDGKELKRNIGTDYSYLFSYDYKDRLSNKTHYFLSNQLESLTNYYDNYDRLWKTVDTKANSHSITTESSFNDDGTVSSITRLVGSTSQESFTEDYEYDSDKRLTCVINNDQITNSIIYDSCNHISSIATYNGYHAISPSMSKSFGYYGGSTDLNRTTNYINRVTNNVTSSVFDNHLYEYDVLGNITKETITKRNSSISSYVTYDKEYTYDNLNRLIKEKDYNKLKSYVYTYDVRGNLTTKSTYSFTINNPSSETLDSTLAFSYYNTGWKDQLLNDGTYSYTYDQLGRPNKFKNQNIYYDNENRIYTIGSTTFTYDINGLRKLKINQYYSTDYYYDNNGLLIKEKRSNYPHIIYHYNGNDVIGFSLKTSSNSQYEDYIYSKNLQNDIIRIYRLSDMTLVGEYDYDAFGNQEVHNHTSDNIADINPFRYRSYYYDTETNLYYLKSRYYSPELMRFLTPDRISILDDTMDNIDACNLYVYCNNNPVMYVDPDGDFNWSSLWKGIGYGVTAVVAIALSIGTFGAGIPVAMSIIAGVTLTAGILTGINAVAEIGDAIFDYNFMEDGLFRGNSSAYHIYAGITEGTAAIGSAVLGIYHSTGQYKAAKYGQKYLGQGYHKAGYTNSGYPRYVSKDGLRQMRFDAPHMYKGEMIGKHLNLESFIGTKPIPFEHVLYNTFKYWIL